MWREGARASNTRKKKFEDRRADKVSTTSLTFQTRTHYDDESLRLADRENGLLMTPLSRTKAAGKGKKSRRGSILANWSGTRAQEVAKTTGLGGVVASRREKGWFKARREKGGCKDREKEAKEPLSGNYY